MKATRLGFACLKHKRVALVCVFIMIFIFEFINNLSGIVSVIPVAIFIFTATLLGTAIEKSRYEENHAIEKDQEDTKNDIKEMEKQLGGAKKDGKLDKIFDNQTLLKLITHQKETDKKIKKIKNKYNSIDLTNSCIYPFFCFVGAMCEAQLGLFMAKTNYSLAIFFLILFTSILFLVAGFVKIYKSLILVQDISVSRKENESYDRLRETIKQALLEDKNSSLSDVSIKFVDKSFPLNLNPQTELAIKFRAQLTKGSYLNNVSIWFFVPDGFELIIPEEKESWRQSPDYDPPNIRTVKISIGDLSVGPVTPGTLKLRVPLEIGNYKLKYKVYANGYVGKENFIELNIV